LLWLVMVKCVMFKKDDSEVLCTWTVRHTALFWTCTGLPELAIFVICLIWKLKLFTVLLNILPVWIYVHLRASKFLPFRVPSESRPPFLLDPLVFSLLSLFWKNKSGLIPSQCCLCVCWTNLYGIWYVQYHGTLAHPSGVLHKSLPSVSVSMCVSHYCC
jgi:hypothetical protein